MKVLTEVKLRENEHKLIQSLASQISDLSTDNKLATRKRRLLYSGTFRLVSPSLPLPRGSTGQPSLSSFSPPPTKDKRSRRLVDAINVWDRSPGRSNSIKSTASSITASMRSFNTSSTGSASVVLDNVASTRMPKLKEIFKRKPNRTAGTSDNSHPDSYLVASDHIQLFVFSDLLLLVTPRQSPTSQYDLVPGIGVSRLFSVSPHLQNPQGLTVPSLIFWSAHHQFQNSRYS